MKALEKQIIRLMVLFCTLGLVSACGQDIQFAEEGLSKLSGTSPINDLGTDDGDSLDLDDSNSADDGIDDILSGNKVDKAHQCDSGGKDKKVRVCHLPNNSSEKAHSICISKSALAAHVLEEAAAAEEGHSKDYLGECL